MLRITAIAVACVLCTVGAAFAEIEIWDGDDIDPPPTINHVNNTIEIEAAGTYGFRAWDGVDTLEEIQSITVDSGVTGAVTVTIAWDEYGGNGATDVWTGNLTLTSYDVELAGLEISGSLGTTSTGFTCEDVTGDIDIGGSMATGGDVTCGDIDGSIDIVGNMAPGRVAHPSRSEGWGRDCIEEALRSNDAPNRQARHFAAVN